MPKVHNLTPKQMTFVEEYCLDQAAIRAGYSAKTAQVQSSRLFSKAMVQRAIEARLDEHRVRCDVTIDKLTDELDVIRLMAMEALNPSAGVAAIMAKAKLHGLLVKKVEQRVELSVGERIAAAQKRLRLVAR